MNEYSENFFYPEKEDVVEDIENIEVQEAYFKEIGKRPLLTQEEEKNLFRRLAAGDESARREIVEANLRLVVNIAKRFQNQGLELMDLINEGNIGLINATRRFKPELGYRFSTYATWWIRQAVGRGVSNGGSLMRLPVHVGELVWRFKQVNKKLEQQLGRTPRDEEIMAALKIDREKYNQLIGYMQKISSLDTPVGEEGDATVGDFIADESDEPVEDQIVKRERTQLLKEALQGCLTEKEQQVIALRYGLGGGKPRTLEEIGRIFGVTRERVRQIEKAALDKLRNSEFGREFGSAA